ncbi:flavin reductase [Nonomuraea sp. MCN248]|uniref:Flavin reductase n=1 Tax=Nonomuraea corallina TaxID=2989783 RepID=A0ABT4SJP2_9ACTN|nr:flavin reductase [Nonomuraea corallina]MDA0637233.1 flavin reductase [Nonomuraea corallina]
MTASGESFRAAMAQWPSGVVVVTTGPEGAWHGMTASSFTSVSLDPPMVLVCLAHHTRTHRLITERGFFAVSVLGKDQVAIGRRFAGQEAVADRFAGGSWIPAKTGAPVLADAVAWLDCRVAHAYPGGDHTIFVGEVAEAATPRRVAPVLFHSRAWGQLADPLPDRIGVADTGLLAVLRARGFTGDRLAGIARALRAAGSRVRLFDPDGADPYGEPPPPQDLDPATASALITEPAQVRAVAAAGAGVAEFTAGVASAGPGQAARVLEAAGRAGLTAVGHIAEAFARDRADHVVATVARLAELGCDEIGLEEGAVAATPVRVRGLLQDAAAAAGTATVRVALRERHGIGLVNALVAMKSGVRHFDTTLGGVDGALPAEDVLFLAGQLDVDTAVDRSVLIASAAELESTWGSVLPGRTYRFAN